MLSSGGDTRATSFEISPVVLLVAVAEPAERKAILGAVGDSMMMRQTPESEVNIRQVVLRGMVSSTGH